MDDPAAGSATRRVFLIADVRGYTRFTREHGDAAAARLATAFAALAREAVEARDGRVVEIRGDEVLAVFGAPRAAVRAATELVATCAEEAALDPTLPLLVGIGIDAGEAVSVEDGFRGAALNTAARLCSHAAAGQVLATADLAGEVGELRGIRFREAGTAELKGFDAPVAMIQAQAERSTAAPALPADAPAPAPPPVELETDVPLCGRERELAWLRGAWREAARGGGRIVLLSGPAGSGKTRLAAEVAEFASTRGAAVRYAGAGGAAAALGATALRGVPATSAPTLVVLDDLDVTGAALVPLLAEGERSIENSQVLVVGCVREPEASPALSDLIERIGRDGGGHRRLSGLDVNALREIARLYAGEGVDQVPLESIARASAGLPGRVHELLAGWARDEAGRRLAAASGYLAAERTRRAADLEFANNAIALSLRRLYDGESARDEPADREACPYKGLAAFDGGDAGRFFGRENLVGEVAARTVGTGLLAVVGVSGSGKSSLIAAGLLPSLAAGLLPGSERWRASKIRPGDRPLAALDAALAEHPGADDERRVLVIDQFEELFTTCHDERERSAFVERLLATVEDGQGAVAVVAIRADYYGECGAHPELARRMAANQVLVGPMTADELGRAIELPARRARARVERALVEALVAEAGDAPGALPLLSTALVELWGERHDGWLRLQDHERLGGLRGAVARLADRSYDELSEGEREAAHRLFLRLVTVAGEGGVARRRVDRAELDLAHDPVLATVVERLTADRLLTADGQSLEVAHEALLREWPRMQTWLAEDAQGRELREHLTQSAGRWDAAQRDAGELYRGARLQSTLDWSAEHTRELNALEREFLAASLANTEREISLQRRAIRRLRGALLAVGVLLLVAAVVGVAALVQRSSAQHEATVALARQLGAEAVSEPRIDRALLLAREAVRLSPSRQTDGTLLTTVLRTPQAIGTFTLPLTVRPLAVAVAPDGRTLAVLANDGLVHLVDARTHRDVQPPIREGGFPLPAVFSAGGNVLVTSGGPFARPYLVVRDGTSFAVRRTLPLDPRFDSSPTDNTSLPVAVSPDGSVVAFGYATLRPNGRDGASYVDLFRSSDGNRTTVRLPGPGTRAVAFTNGGSGLVTVGDRQVTTWLVRSATSIRPVRSVRLPPSASASISAAGVSPDGHTVALGASTGAVTFVDTRSGAVTPGNGAHSGRVDAVVWRPGSREAISAGDDGRVIVWDAASGRVVDTLTGHGGQVKGAGVTADGRTLYSASLDGAVFSWALGARGRFGTPFRIDRPVSLAAGEPQTPPLALAHDGAGFAVRRTATEVGLYATGSRRLLGVVRLPSGFGTPGALAWSPTAPEIAVTGTNGHVGLWHVSAAPRPVRMLAGLPDRGVASSQRIPLEAPQSVAFSPDGRLVAASDVGYTSLQAAPTSRVALWDAASGRLLRRPLVLQTPAGALAFSPDGARLAVAVGGDILLLDVRTGRVARTLRAADAVSALAFARDGTLAAGTDGGIIELWDAASGRRLGGPTLTHPAPVASVSFAPSGRELVTTGGSDGSAGIWTSPTLQQLGTSFGGPPSAWGNAAYTPDGSRIVNVFDDGTGLVWPVSRAALVARACGVAGRQLTPEEWSRYVGGRAYAPVCSAGDR